MLSMAWVPFEMDKLDGDRAMRDKGALATTKVNGNLAEN